MHQIRVSDIMSRDAVTCKPTTSLKVVGWLMAEEECGFVPVLEGERVVGVITDRDLGLTLARYDQRASSMTARLAMSRDVVACADTDPVTVALDRMRGRGVRRLVVLGPEQRLAGVLSIDNAALAARTLEQPGEGTPLYQDVALTLQAICVAQASPVRYAD